MELQNLKKLAQLKAVILSMEKDFGLAEMSEHERLILNAMSEFSEGEDGLVTSRKLRSSLLQRLIRTDLSPGTKVTPRSKHSSTSRRPQDGSISPLSE